MSSAGRDGWIRKMLGGSDVPATARLIGLIVASYTDADALQGVWLTNADLARMANLTPGTTSRYVRLLKERGWLARDIDPGRTSPWYLAWPIPAEDRS
jgi:hypothetical protein